MNEGARGLILKILAMADTLKDTADRTQYREFIVGLTEGLQARREEAERTCVECGKRGTKAVYRCFECLEIGLVEGELSR
jgi:hypothetical protein